MIGGWQRDIGIYEDNQDQDDDDDVVNFVLWTLYGK